MTQLTLSYFDSPTSRGEECRLALFVAGLPFTDERLKGPEWELRRASTPFGALPVLSAEGHRPVAQSNAILRLVGSQRGLHPTDPWEAARHEAVMGAIEDMRVRLGQTRLGPESERQQARQEFAQGFLRSWASHVEGQLGDPFVGGAALQVADLKLFVALSPLRKGFIDHIAPTVFDEFPKLVRLHEAVGKHPKIQAWYAR